MIAPLGAPYVGPIVQYAWVVPDLAAAVRAWHDRFGIGPFMVNRDIRLDDCVHRGVPATIRFSTAIAQSGDAQIELIEQLVEGPSAYRDTVPAGTTAFHHVAVLADDYDATLDRIAATGDAVAVSGRLGAMRFVYVDATATLGCMIEVIERGAGILTMFDRVRQAAADWDRDSATLLRERR